MSARTASVLGIVLACLASVYLALVIVMRVDGILFPGNEFSLPSIRPGIPGTDIKVPGKISISVPGVTAPEDEEWTPSDQMIFLVLGLDKRPTEELVEGARADTMMLVSLDSHAKRMSILGIPRDLLIEVPYPDENGGVVWDLGKINTAYFQGLEYGVFGSGAQASMATIERNFDIRPNHYVVIDWEGFKTLIDAIGGVDVDMPEEVCDYESDALFWFGEYCVGPGLYHMNGEQALGYSRVRTDSDFKRIERQQLIIRATVAQGLDVGVLTRIPELWDSYRGAVETSVNNVSLPGLGLLARDMDFDQIDTFSLGDAVTDLFDGAYYAVPIWDQTELIIQRFLADPSIRDEYARITVLYPPDHPEYAEEIERHLVGYGFIYDQFTFEPDTGGTAGVFDRSGNEYTAERLARLLDLREADPLAGATGTGVLPDADIVVRVGNTLRLKSP